MTLPWWLSNNIFFYVMRSGCTALRLRAHFRDEWQNFECCFDLSEMWFYYIPPMIVFKWMPRATLFHATFDSEILVRRWTHIGGIMRNANFEWMFDFFNPVSLYLSSKSSTIIFPISELKNIRVKNCHSGISAIAGKIVQNRIRKSWNREKKKTPGDDFDIVFAEIQSTGILIFA